MLLYRYCIVFHCIFHCIPNTSPRGLHLEVDLTESFFRYEFGGLIFGGASFRNFTVPNVLHSDCKNWEKLIKIRRAGERKSPGDVILEFLRGGCAARTLKPLAYTRGIGKGLNFATLHSD